MPYAIAFDVRTDGLEHIHDRIVTLTARIVYIINYYFAVGYERSDERKCERFPIRRNRFVEMRKRDASLYANAFEIVRHAHLHAEFFEPQARHRKIRRLFRISERDVERAGKPRCRHHHAAHILRKASVGYDAPL